MKIKTIAIIQARMGSSRFPGKSMAKIGKWSLVELVMKRVQQSSKVDLVMLATSTSPNDDVLADYVEKSGFQVFRGSEDDVLSRFKNAAEQYHPEIVVRITGDCPLISHSIIDHAIAIFEEKQVDYLAIIVGKDKQNAYPRGFDVEVAKYTSITDAANNATRKYEREHVMPYLYTNPEKFTTYYIEPEPEYSRPKYRLCVDSKLDFDLIMKVYEFFGDQLLSADSLEIIQFLDMNPEIAEINLVVEQKHFTESDARSGQ